MSSLLVSRVDANGSTLYRFDTDEHSFTMEREGQPEGVLVPGFVDIHIHGAFGIDFMSASTDDMLSLCGQLAGEGYEAFLPTTITASVEDVMAAVNRLPDHPMITGFHLEGPFISPEYPGAQPLKDIASIPDSTDEWDSVWNHPKLRVVTLAPELEGAKKLIRRLTGRGVICSMGHTNATYPEVMFAQMEGLCHATHTYNAMRPLHHREPGALGAALALDGITCELIYDRIHVSQPAAKILIDAKVAKGKAIAVSDSSAATGVPPGTSIAMWGHDCIVGEGQVNLKSNGSLAGSAISLRNAFANLTQDFDVSVAQEMCCLAPARALGLKTRSVWNLVDAKTGALLATYAKN